MAERLRTVQWRDGALVLLDQTRIPETLQSVSLRSVEEVVDAIRRLVVRGAPAIGAAAAYGVAIAARQASGPEQFAELCRSLQQARPTAVNLAWAVARVRKSVDSLVESGRADEAFSCAVAEADRICAEDMAANQAIARHGRQVLEGVRSVITHCNTGDLATVSGGTALGVVLHAHEMGQSLHVFVDETRPRFQGLRLTAWELGRAGIPATIIPDGAGAFLMQQGRVDVAIVGADRIAANGDAANKIGTFSLACCARAHGVPFYVAAPFSTFDLSCPSGAQIPIEERDAGEVLQAAGLAAAPEGAEVLNLAFDVTPAALVTGIITEHGILRAPYQASIRALAESLV